MALIQHGLAQRVQVTMGGAALAPFLPLGLANLEEYYDARALTAANGATIATWADLSGHSPTRDMATTGLPGGMVGPSMIASGGSLSPKGARMVAFNGTNTGLVTSTINPFPAATNGHSFHTYGRWRATAAPPAAFAGSLIWQTGNFGSVPKELGLQTVTTNLAYWRDSGGFHTDGSRPNGLHLLSWVLTPPNVGIFYVDGVAALTATYTLAAAGADTTSLSDCINNNVPLNTDMGFFFWCSTAHSAATIAQIYLWSQIFWGY